MKPRDSFAEFFNIVIEQTDAEVAPVAEQTSEALRAARLATSVVVVENPSTTTTGLVGSADAATVMAVEPCKVSPEFRQFQAKSVFTVGDFVGQLGAFTCDATIFQGGSVRGGAGAFFAVGRERRPQASCCKLCTAIVADASSLTNFIPDTIGSMVRQSATVVSRRLCARVAAFTVAIQAALASWQGTTREAPLDRRFLALRTYVLHEVIVCEARG